MTIKQGIMVAAVLGGVFGAGTITACGDDDNNLTTGTAGTGGTGTGGTSAGGVGGLNASTFSMTMTGAQEVPPNSSTATANVTVVLNRNNGAVTVTGSFTGLGSDATVAHIHGPAAVGVAGPILFPLNVPSAPSGSISGTGTMSTVQMNDMLGGQTYVNIHSVNFPNGELRAQIVPTP
jgi:hypothetical protein